MKNVLILGSAGQIGKYLCDYLELKDYNVIKFDIVDDSKYDLRDTTNNLLEESIKKADFVFFLAFDVGGSRYLNKYQHTFEFIQNNNLIMTNTFNLLKKYNTPFIFASSQMSNMSYSPYGILKAVGESYSKALNGRIVKFWNVYGVEHDYEKSHVVTDFILKAAKNNVIDMLTDGEETRQLLYAQDCVECLEILMNNYQDVSANDELHITSFNDVKIIDIAKIIADKFNAKIVKAETKDNVQKDKKNIPSEYILNFWKPKTNVNDGIDHIIQTMKKENVI
jgi:nucleoside-diphosphate-sugar epimerase